jgi:hypothetical protein
MQWCSPRIGSGVHSRSMRDVESRNVLVLCKMQWRFTSFVNGMHICSMRDEESRNVLV